MYYVPDGTDRCGFYECKECGARFLSLSISSSVLCPYCSEDLDMEIGPDDEMPNSTETALLREIVTSTEEVEKLDSLLSLAITGGDYNWIF